ARVGLIAKVPAFPRVQRARQSTVMKGRPITTEELERMIGKLPDVFGEAAVPGWRHLLEGLWWSGLRLGESLALSWDDPSLLMVDIDGEAPVFHIPGHLQKSHRDQVLPMAPEFAKFLEKTPAGQRNGYVFDPRTKTGQRAGFYHASAKIAKAG